MSSSFETFTGKIILVATIKAQPGKANEFEEKLLAVQAFSTSEAEPGCLTYRVNRAGDEFLIFEEYADQKAIGAHREGPVFQALVKDSATLTLHEETTIKFYQESGSK